MTPPFTTAIEPAAPDHVAVPLLFSVRFDSNTVVDAGKLIPAFALVVAFVPTTHEAPLSDEHIVPPVQFKSVAKFRIPGAAPARVPALKFTWVVEIVAVPVPKFIAA